MKDVSELSVRFRSIGLQTPIPTALGILRWASVYGRFYTLAPAGLPFGRSTAVAGGLSLGVCEYVATGSLRDADLPWGRILFGNRGCPQGLRTLECAAGNRNRGGGITSSRHFSTEEGLF